MQSATASLVTAVLLATLAGCTGRGISDNLNKVTDACRVKGLETAARCGSVEVPENPAEPAGKKITVKFAVLPAAARIKAPDPLFILAGGPGQSAQMLAGQVGKVFAGINRKRDIVFIDQRGTGASVPLSCDMPKGGGTMEELASSEASFLAVKKCRDALIADGRDTRWYATQFAVPDFEAVRIKLGAAKVNLWGGSYGTRAGLEYARQFASSVRTLTLDGVAPADGILPVQMAVDTHAALTKLFAACEADAACSKQYPQLAQRTAALLSPQGAKLMLTDRFTLEKRSYSVDGQAIAGAIRSPLYSTQLASVLPHAIARAAMGDGDSLLALGSSLSGNLEENFSMGMHLAVVCAEDMPRIDAAAIKSLEGTLLGSAYVDQYRRLCEGWKIAPVPSAFYAPVTADIPVLIFSGGLDPVTAPRHGEKVAKWFARSQHIVMPTGGHIVTTQPCAAKLLEDFIKSGGSQKIDGTCLQALPRPSFYMQPQRASAAPGASE
jgi:pimeloyl-ACP methyl ester carboxylesterase